MNRLNKSASLLNLNNKSVLNQNIKLVRLIIIKKHFKQKYHLRIEELEHKLQKEKEKVNKYKNRSEKLQDDNELLRKQNTKLYEIMYEMFSVIKLK